MAREFSSSNIMSVGEMIDNAFGEPDVNIVNHKLIQTVLYILARQLRILERRVEVEIGPIHQSSLSSLSVTEVKVHAMQKKKRPSDKGAASKTSTKAGGGLAGDAVGGAGAGQGSGKDGTQGGRASTKGEPGRQSLAASLSDKTSSDKTYSDKTSSGKTSSDKTSSNKTSSSDKTSSKSSSDKQRSKLMSIAETSRKGPTDYATLLDAIELQREAELRVIHQRADSLEETEKNPSPMASMDSVEAQYEKLLVVERIPSDEARALAARGRSGSREKAPRISVVTQDEFEKLAIIVRQLQQKFGPVGIASFPENAHLMQELRKGASLTDAMAALQLSARLEASERALQQMLALVTALASKTPGIDLTGGGGADIQLLFGTAGAGGGPPAVDKSPAFQQPALESKKEPSPPQSSSEESVTIPLPHLEDQEEPQAPPAGTGGQDEVAKEPPDQITYDELDNAMQELYDVIMKTLNDITSKSTANANNAFKLASKLEGKLEAALDMGTRMEDLETLVSNYSVKINILDTSLSSQMTNYQEELTQMQHDLETALETMAEVLANTGGDTTAVAELNAHFSNLQSDIEDTMMRQKDLSNTQEDLAIDFEALRKQIETLREIKSDREEVADALRDKAGLGALNGLVSLQQFDAVRGDIEKRIVSAYDKFNSQEMIWQKAIDDLLRLLNDKSDWVELVSLKDEINKHLENLRCKLNAMMEIVGEPRAAAVMKKLHRDAACISCATRADMELEEHAIVPALPAMRPPKIGVEAPKPKEDGDHGLCYLGQPIPHPRDPRSHFCKRWCGGSHTVVSSSVSRAPAGMTITPALRQVTAALGTDGKTYMVDEPLKPCVPCLRKTTPQSSIATEQIQDQEEIRSDMTPSFFRASLGNAFLMMDNETPPPPTDED